MLMLRERERERDLDRGERARADRGESSRDDTTEGASSIGEPAAEKRDSWRFAWRGKDGVSGRRGSNSWVWGRPCGFG